MNKFMATGNLTRDPEMRYTTSGKAVTEFSIAVNEGSGDKKTVEYFDCQVWDKLAELVAEHCRKGRKVLIEGRVTTESWTDKTTQQKRSKIRIKCHTVEFLDRPGAAQYNAGAAQAPSSNDDDLADLPF